jgi:hypothetical protein
MLFCFHSNFEFFFVVCYATCKYNQIDKHLCDRAMQWIISGELQFSNFLRYEKAFNEKLVAYKKNKVIFFHFCLGWFSTCLKKTFSHV